MVKLSQGTLSAFFSRSGSKNNTPSKAATPSADRKRARVVESDEETDEIESLQVKRPKRTARALTDSDDEVSYVDVDDESIEEEEEKTPRRAAKKQRTMTDDGKASPAAVQLKSTLDGGANVKSPMDLTHLPPISDLGEMFGDIVSNQKLRDAGFERLLDKLDGRKLRVATMCSGTESPLLALSMIGPLVEARYGKKLEVEHVFSCEIEPFKQAYIERNFSPPILFRDVCELGEDFATTAYGAKVEVPGDVDILIAGTSCVDFSNLNNKKQEIEGHGESAKTFQGMLKWVERHRPTVVLLENVLSAPWEASVCPKFRGIKYDAQWVKLDTKQYYIPHTRMRGYMCAVDSLAAPTKVKTLGKVSIPEKWKSLLQNMARPASSPIEAFLMADDDPRIVRVRAAMQDNLNGRSAIDWARCEVRHRNARFTEELGDRRPLTLWMEGGGCTMPDFGWNDWALLQPERVLDLMDISVLRYATRGLDASYKTILWNLSQNVDRIGYPKGGLCPCMTPSMIPYISNRGGPLTGYEALGMQGLPVDKLLLTRESEDNCMDLAGNAMSTTVVGSCILAALTLATDRIQSDRHAQTVQEVKRIEIVQQEVSALRGAESLPKQSYDLGAVSQLSTAVVLDHANRSRRLCRCEGRTGMTHRKIVQCQDCMSTACSRCMGRPEHNYPRNDAEEVDLDRFQLDRLDPRDFEKELKTAIPMRATFGADLPKQFAMDQPQAGIKAERWRTWCEGAQKALTDELRFRGLHRREVWTASYSSDHVELELVLDATQPEWRLFVKPDKSLACNSWIRELFSAPIARLSLDKTSNKSLLHGTWELCLPTEKTFGITLTGGSPGKGANALGVDDFGDLVPSWEMTLGIQTKEFREKRVWSYLDVAVDPAARNDLDLQIDGRYRLVDKCAAANNSLHRLEGGESLFFFLDPGRCTPNSMDHFIFSISTRRLGYGETRPVAATVDASWRQNHTNKSPPKQSKSKVTVRGKWTQVPDLHLHALAEQTAELAIATPSILQIRVDAERCTAGDLLLSCRLPLTSGNDVWPSEWRQVDKINEKQIFRALSWLTERLKAQVEGFSDWTDVHAPEEFAIACQRCAPTAPDIHFGEAVVAAKSGSGKPKLKIVGIEDIGEAGRYEQALKSRPVAFASQYRLVDGFAEFRIGLNVASMMHQALARLPSGIASAKCSWRLDNGYVEKQRLVLPSFARELSRNSNKGEVEAAQPKGFRLPLRPEQLRSLTWMLSQEREDVQPFVEEEIVEALLNPLGWRAEARATREVTIRGGVLADEVGYGKTAISLGLIAASPPRQPESIEGYISTKATLIIVPAHLIKQWPAEVEKFMGKTKCIKVETMTQLKRLTIEDIQNADIVCVQVSLFKAEAYLNNLSALSARGRIPMTKGRHFQQCHAETVAGLRDTAKQLKADEATAAYTDMREGRDADLEARTKVFVQSKRMKGRAYREHKKWEETQKGKGQKSKPQAASSAKEVHFAPASPLKRKHIAVIVPTTDQTSIAIEDEPEDDDDGEPVDLRAEWKASRGKDIDALVKADPWGFKTKAVANDASQMSCPVFELFNWNRLIIDEYTYLEETPVLHRMAMNMKSDRRWILSGTPPVEDFAAIKTISVFLGINLGVDEMPQNQQQQRQWFNDFTQVEKFHSFREVKSSAWHQARYRQAERFLRQFVRQNKAEIDEIESVEVRNEVVLPAAERAIYLELLHHLQALDMNIKKVKKGYQSDREKRIAEAFGESESATEALLKRCSHFDLDKQHDSEGNAILMCDALVAERTKQLRDCELDLHRHVWELLKEERQHEEHLYADDSIFRNWTMHMRNRADDADATRRIQRMLKVSQQALDANAKEMPQLVEQPTAAHLDRQRVLEAMKKRKAELNDAAAADAGKRKKAARVMADSDDEDEEADERSDPVEEDEDEPVVLLLARKRAKAAKAEDDEDDDGGAGDKLISRQPDAVDDLKRKFKDKSHQLKRLEKELVGRERSLRFFEVVRDLQRLNSTSLPPDAKPRIKFICNGANCAHRVKGERRPLPLQDVCVFSTCGHVGCYDCLDTASRSQSCPAEGCQSPGVMNVIVKSTSLGEEEDIAKEAVIQKHFGTKIEQVVGLIKSFKPDEKVLLFCQFKDLTEKVAIALDAHDVPYLRIVGSASAKSKALQRFQNESTLDHRPAKGERLTKVLVLNITDESASGANLTGANHVVFLSPILADSLSKYVSQETQAIGRAVRYGQRRKVHIHRFVTLDSVDTEIYAAREKERLAQGKEELEDF